MSTSNELRAPIVRVLPLLGIPHLDRPFDYLVPSTMDAEVQPGVRVRVRFAGRLVDAIVLERARTTPFQDKLRPIERVISPLVVMPPQTWQLVERLADHYAGTRSDLLKTYIPPRHATAESAGLFADGATWPNMYSKLDNLNDVAAAALQAATELMGDYIHGPAFVQALIDGRNPRAALNVLPGTQPETVVARIAAAFAWSKAHSNRAEIEGDETPGILILAPNVRSVQAIVQELGTWLAPAQIVQLTSAVGPQARYRRFLSILQGQARVVVGTRAAALVPLHHFSAVFVVEESDEAFADTRAPYVHTREVATLRATEEHTALLFAHVHRSAEVQHLLNSGIVHALMPQPERTVAMLPHISGLAETDFDIERELSNPGARISAKGFAAIRNALQKNQPVLIQVPRRGYAPALACAKCKTSARCRHCNGPLELPSPEQQHGTAGPPGTVIPQCRWCGHLAGNFTCTACGNHTLRMSVIGQERTVEELGKAFPGVPLRASGGEHIIEKIKEQRSIIVATPGAEPQGSYGAALMLDPWMSLQRADLRAVEQALRQWMKASNLVKPAQDGGEVIIMADGSLRIIELLKAWNVAAAAQLELTERNEAWFPPASSIAAIDGTTASIAMLMDTWQPLWEAQTDQQPELLGPVPLPPGIRLPAGMEPHQRNTARRLLIRVPRSESHTLGSSLRKAQAIASAQASSKTLQRNRVVIDPVRIG